MALRASFFSSSSSSSFIYAWPYDVFLSFRGCDTRHGFTGNLYKALTDKGIHTFFDDEELKKGDEITPALVKAIQDSRIAIVVFSVNYASSSFCLAELAVIMECVKEKGRLVLPIFYDVNPCDVRHQTGSYGKAMTKHEGRFKDDKQKVQKWREALHQAANLSGEDFKLGNEYEYVFIEKIVKVISDKINRVPLHIANYPVGLESRVLEVNSLLNDGFDVGVLIVGIYGIGGIGKTILARAVYNFIADQFQALCFLENVRKKSIKLGLVHLQETLLSEMVGDKNIKLQSVYKGIPIIKQRLHQKKVLLVLDDVDDIEQLQAIVGGADWFGFGSRVIVTTRDKHLLECHGIKRIYEVKGLREKEALELLSWHSFKYDNIDPSYMDILKHAVTYACGLPLALEVIGSNLFGKSIEDWRFALDQYGKIPNKKIQEILKISFDALEECQQKIFLDIACCFNGYNWDEVHNILHARHGVSMKYGISVLVQKSLLISNKYGYVTIHNLIQDMGREIIRQESPKHPGKRSRLWLPKDVVQVLEEDIGTSEIEIMILDALEFEKIAVEWEGETFKKMRNLEILVIRDVCFSQGAKHLPNSLRVLEWWNYPSKSLPSDFHPMELAIFKLPNSSLMLAEFVEKRKFLNLKVLNLDNSNIGEIPDISGVPNLEELSFEACGKLVKVHESVGFSDKLRYLNASCCKKLKRFPALMLPSLKSLDLFGCSSLKNFPEILGPMEGIEGLFWPDHTSIKELPSSITNLTKLTYLAFNVHGKLRLTNSIAMFQSLITMNVWGFGGRLQFPKLDKDEGQGSSLVSSSAKFVAFRGCNMLDESIPTVLAWFRNAVDLDLGKNDFTIIPESIKELYLLRRLFLSNCKRLKEIRAIPPNIKVLSAVNCVSLTPWCRSMLLNEELHSRIGCKRVHLPGSSIPNWFEHTSRSSISLWFRNEIPLVSVCVVSRSDAFGYICTWPDVIIDGQKTSHRRSLPLIAADHITINDQVRILSSNHELAAKYLSKNEWHHVVYRVVSHCNMQELGVHVHNHESNMEDIRFAEPHGDLNSFTFIEVLASFRNAVTLNLTGSDYTILPKCVKELCMLRELILDDCKKLREVRGIPPNIKELSAAKCMSLTPLCRSMLLNEELHSSSGYKRFHLPGSSIPKWFEHTSKNSISVWFRNKIPSISVCFVSRSDRLGFGVVPRSESNGLTCTWPEVIINSIPSFLPKIWLSHGANHITIVDQVRILSDHEVAGKFLLENKWNHVVYRVPCGNTGWPAMKEIGIHVHKHEINREDIRFTDPEQQKDLASLASVETQSGKWLSSHLPPPHAMNSLNDDVNGDSNSITLIQDTDEDPNFVPATTQLHSDPCCSEPGRLCGHFYCWGKSCSQPKRLTRAVKWAKLIPFGTAHQKAHKAKKPTTTKGSHCLKSM